MQIFFLIPALFLSLFGINPRNFGAPLAFCNNHYKTYTSKQFRFSVNYPCDMVAETSFEGSLLTIQYLLPTTKTVPIGHNEFVTYETNIIVVQESANALQSQLDIEHLDSWEHPSLYYDKQKVIYKKSYIGKKPVLQFRKEWEQQTQIDTLLRVGGKTYFVELKSPIINDELMKRYNEVILSIR